VRRRRFVVERPETSDSTNRTNGINSRYVDTESIPFWNTVFTRRVAAAEIRYNVGIVRPPARSLAAALFRKERTGIENNQRTGWPLFRYAMQVEIGRVHCGSSSENCNENANASRSQMNYARFHPRRLTLISVQLILHLFLGIDYVTRLLCV